MDKFYIFLKIVTGLIVVYALILTVGYFAIKYNLTNEPGKVDDNNQKFSELNNEIKKDAAKTETTGATSEISQFETKALCQLNTINQFAPVNGQIMKDLYKKDKNEIVLAKMELAVNLKLKDNADFQNQIAKCDASQNGLVLGATTIGQVASNNNTFSWVNYEEWNIIKTAIMKDKPIIDKVSEQTGIDERTLISTLVVEQLRIYFSQREEYEKFFKPYKILGNFNNMAWGVMSLKEANAIDIENNLKDKNSPFYLGEEYEKILDFSTENIKEERYQRLTNDKDHYYPYLYGALALKEFEMQWQRAGVDINGRPEILATLYNIGIKRSKPHPEPMVGGSELDIGNQKYTFGALAYEFYYSGELSVEFPLN